MSVGISFATEHRLLSGVGGGAQHAALRFLEAEARALAFTVTALLIGAAADALGATDGDWRPSGTERRARLGVGDPSAALARCLALVRSELMGLPDPTPRRFVDAAILSLAEPLPGAGMPPPVAEAAASRRH